MSTLTSLDQKLLRKFQTHEAIIKGLNDFLKNNRARSVETKLLVENKLHEMAELIADIGRGACADEMANLWNKRVADLWAEYANIISFDYPANNLNGDETPNNNDFTIPLLPQLAGSDVHLSNSATEQTSSDTSSGDSKLDDKTNVPILSANFGLKQTDGTCRPNDLSDNGNSAGQPKVQKKIIPLSRCRVKKNRKSSKSQQKRQNQDLICHVCGKALSTKTGLRQHQVVHSNKRPYRCGWTGCDHASRRRGDILSHIRLIHLKVPRTIPKQNDKIIPDAANYIIYNKNGSE